MLKFVRPRALPLAAAVACSLIAAGAAAIYAVLVGPLLRALLQEKPLELFGQSLEGRALLIQLPLFLFAVALIKALAQAAQGGLMQAATAEAMARLRRGLYEKLLSFSPGELEAEHSGALLSRFSSDVAALEFSVGQALASYVKDGLQIVTLLGVCLAIDGKLFVLGFVFLPLSVIPVSRFAKGVKRLATRTQTSLSSLTELSSDLLQNLAVVRAFDGGPRLLTRFDREQGRYLADMKRSLFLRGAFTPTLELLGIAGAAAAIGFGARAIATDPELAGRLLSFLAASLLLYQPLKSISGTFAMVKQGEAAAERLFSLLDRPLPSDEGRPCSPLTGDLRFEGLTVRYGERHALSGVTFTVRAGEKVALVGASGAGKSTLFSALLRFVEPASGLVRWDGEPLQMFSRSSVRARLGWVPQEPFLFSGTIRENLSLGGRVASDAELWEALERAGAKGFVASLPAGLDAPLGEKGSGLSGGQKQRLSIARAFLRAPSVLLLDEPTSALDAATEREVETGLAALMQGRTALVIAHRLATVRNADRIVVLDAGRVVEEGRHEELLARGGRYAQLCETLSS